MRAPLICEGLHDRGIPSLWGRGSHQLDSYPKLPLNKKIEVVAEKLDAQDLGGSATHILYSSCSGPVTTKNWIIVTPKKRLKASFGPRVPKSLLVQLPLICLLNILEVMPLAKLIQVAPRRG